MEPVAISFGIGLIVAGIYAWCSPMRWLSMLAWSGLALGWLVAVLIEPSGAKYLWIWMVMDAAIGTVAMSLGVRHKAFWAMILATLYLGQSMLHVVWAYMNVALPTDHLRLIRYETAINLLLAGQMVAVSWPGALNGVALCRARLRLLSRDRNSSGVAS